MESQTGVGELVNSDSQLVDSAEEFGGMLLKERFGTFYKLRRVIIMPIIMTNKIKCIE
jgi:hypothetical protein